MTGVCVAGVSEAFRKDAVLFSFCFCGKQHDQNQLGGRWEGLIQLITHRPSWREARVGTQGKNWKRTRETQLLGFVPGSCSITFLHSPGPPAWGWYCLQWAGPLASISNQEKVSMDMPTGQSGGGIFPFVIPSSQVCLGLCQGDKSN